MRKLSRGWIWAALPLLAALSWAVGAGCENTAGDCELTAECAGAPGSTASCDPSKTSAVADTCGAFVSATAEAGGDGTRAKPFATFAEAVALATKNGTRRVYACSETFAEAVELPGETALYGGLDCAKGWAFSTKGRTTLAPASGVPITFDAGATIHVENVHAKAPDGAPPDDAIENPRSGGSSIAAVALPSSDVELLRCELEAGKGADGKAADPDGPLGVAPDGKVGADACGTGKGGATFVSQCPDPSAPGGEGDTSGGRGGDGEGAQPVEPPAPGNGPHGGIAGTLQMSMALCSEGGPGSPGTNGDAGSGGQSLTTLLDDDFKGAPGLSGKQGISGGGGGGGGGGKACSAAPGGGGGSGGAGGCGGAGGRGGGAGGSSIALWAVDASVSLTQVALKAGVAGQGAAGAAGQKGALGGAGGLPGAVGELSVACGGGAGGEGGQGGPGGGGQGGHSIAAVWKVSRPKGADSTFTAGAAGQGGPGGAGAESTSAGEDGLSCPGLDITEGQCVSL